MSVDDSAEGKTLIGGVSGTKIVSSLSVLFWVFFRLETSVQDLSGRGGNSVGVLGGLEAD
jgi:hypothetical protein